MGVSLCVCVFIICIVKINGHEKDLLSMLSIAYFIVCHVLFYMKIIRISYCKRRIQLKRKYVLLLFAMLLASSQVEQKKKQKVEETVNEVKETIEVTVIQKR